MIAILNRNRLSWLAIILLVALYINATVTHSVNVPYSDDFHQQLSTVIGLEQGDDVSGLLFRQHNVHRLFTTHVFTYLEHAIFGQVNLNHQLFVALFMLIALTLVLASFSRKEHRPIAMLMVSLFLLSPEAGATWVGGTTQYYALVLFGLISIKTLFLIDQRRYLLISVSGMWLAAYSMIGGVLLPLVGIIYLIFSGKIKKSFGLIWALCSICAVAWYFQNFINHGNQPSVFYFIENPKFAFEFTFRVLGNFLSDVIKIYFLTNLTIFISVAFIFLVTVKSSLKRFFLSPEGLAFTFILLVIGSVVAGRVGFNDSDIAYADRYFIYTKALWLLAFIFLLNNQLVSRDIKSFLLGFSSLYLLAAYQFEIANLEIHKQKQSNAMLDHLVRGNSSGFEFANKPRVAGGIVDRAITLGVYSPELYETKSRSVKYLKYSEFKDGLNISVVRDSVVGHYRYFAFSVDADTKIHEVAIVPRNVYGPATLLKAAAEVSSSRLIGVDLKHQDEGIYEVIIDISKFDDSLTHDIFIISLGMITTMGTL